MKRTPIRSKPITRKEPMRATAKTSLPKCIAPGCRVRFVKLKQKQEACSIECAAALGTARAEKERRKEAKRLAMAKKTEAQGDRAKREALLTRSEWMNRARDAFNAYIRARDEGQPCISCGTHGGADALTGGYWDCGHYRSTGAAPHLRFVEANAHRQCKRCNRQLAGNAIAYRAGLVRRLGPGLVEQLEADQTPRRYSIPELQELTALYRAKLKALKAGASPSLDSGAYLGAYIA